jgi:SH3-like domain-containing protein
VTITTAYTSQYPDPIFFPAGVEILVGRHDPNCPGWFWCRAPSGKEGWVHHSFLSGSDGTAVSTHAYSARELTVATGQRGQLIHMMDGWACIRLDNGEEGWIPQNHIALTSDENSRNL